MTPSNSSRELSNQQPRCLASLLDYRMRGGRLPRFLSVEFVTSGALQPGRLDALVALGYRRFKVVRQKLFHLGGKSGSGPFGHEAADLRVGHAWRLAGAIVADFPYLERERALLGENFDLHAAASDDDG